mmetsp:Transcript_4495/g.9755  ORF Transcript_4495/g.9755 Transcript_4495/m.9755 type:complete len:90 (+) Transcript_4495:598-867(+)|eukprot:1750459-Pleurochrysis_carterae.AAC.1
MLVVCIEPATACAILPFGSFPPLLEAAARGLELFSAPAIPTSGATSHPKGASKPSPSTCDRFLRRFDRSASGCVLADTIAAGAAHAASP